MGRPRIYYKEDYDRFFEALKLCDGNISLACKRAGILGGRPRILAWIEQSPYCAEKYKQVIEEIFDGIEQFMTKKARKNINAARFMLTASKEGKRRGYGARTEFTGPDGGPISWKKVMEEVEEIG